MSRKARPISPARFSRAAARTSDGAATLGCFCIFLGLIFVFEVERGEKRKEKSEAAGGGRLHFSASAFGRRRRRRSFLSVPSRSLRDGRSHCCRPAQATLPPAAGAGPAPSAQAPRRPGEAPPRPGRRYREPLAKRDSSKFFDVDDFIEFWEFRKQIVCPCCVLFSSRGSDVR